MSEKLSIDSIPHNLTLDSYLIQVLMRLANLIVILADKRSCILQSIAFSPVD